MAFDLDEEELEATKKLHKKDEIEIGEYIRTKQGNIGKVKEIEFDIYENENCYYLNNFIGVWEHRIAKHSKNIIDLIEVGDIIEEYINFTLEKENGYETIHYISSEFDLESIKERVDLCHYTIKSILTKEQYEKNAYKVGVDNE